MLYLTYLQVLSEPGDGLAESLFLRPLKVGVAQVGADSETVRDTAVQVNLPGLTGLDQGVFGLVTKLSGEYVVDLCW